MAQILDVELPEELAMDLDLLFVDPGCLELARRDIQGDCSPSRGGQVFDLFEHSRGASAQGDEGDAHPIETRQVWQGGQPGIEDQMGGQLAVGLFPEGNEAKDLLCFFSFADIGVGIAESASVGIMGEKNQDAGLPPAARRNIVALYNGMLPIVGHGMEIKVKGVAGQKGLSLKLLVPEGKQPQGGLAVGWTGVL